MSPMLSIRSLYQVGHGPSSSHTMGPAKAVKIIKEAYSMCDRYEVTLYNSLALTGKGHLTEEAIKESLGDTPVAFLTSLDLSKHPNTLIVKGFLYDQLIVEKEVNSTGGGRIVFVGDESTEVPIYPHKTLKEIKKYCKSKHITLHDYVYEIEGEEIKIFLEEIWEAMKGSIIRGIATHGVLPGPLKMKRKAPELYGKLKATDVPELVENRLVASYAFAVSEENASGGIIVTAPTCGACGVLPAVLYYMHEKHHFISKDRIINGLAVAGCQAEVGSACSMAAAAHATLFN